jgi:para-nitrobenzyl esterase
VPTFAAAEARLTAAGPAPTFLYEFGWRSPVLDLGAAHAVEIPFVFDNLQAGAELLGAGAPVKLAADMHATWIRFASTGDPGWQPFDSSYPVMTWDGRSAEVVADPRGDERACWAPAS